MTINDTFKMEHSILGHVRDAGSAEGGVKLIKTTIFKTSHRYNYVPVIPMVAIGDEGIKRISE